MKKLRVDEFEIATYCGVVAISDVECVPGDRLLINRESIDALCDALKEIVKPVKRRAGQRYMRGGTAAYLLCIVDVDMFSLINLSSGSRYVDPIKRGDLQQWPGWSEFELIEC